MQLLAQGRFQALRPRVQPRPPGKLGLAWDASGALSRQKKVRTGSSSMAHGRAGAPLTHSMQFGRFLRAGKSHTTRSPSSLFQETALYSSATETTVRYTGALSSDRKSIVSGSMSWTYRNRSWSWTATIDGQAASSGEIVGKWEYHADAYYFTDVHEFLPDGRMGNDPKASWVLENNQLKVKWPNGWVNVYIWDPQATTLKGTATNSSGDRVDIRLVRMTPLPKK